jgi:hypothetical protein
VAKPTQSEVLSAMSDSELAKAAKLHQQEAASLQRKAAEAQAGAARLRRELRRRKRAAKAGA